MVVNQMGAYLECFNDAGAMEGARVAPRPA